MDEQPYSVTVGDGQPRPRFPAFTDDAGRALRWPQLTPEQRRECKRRHRLKNVWRAAYIWARCASLEGTHGETYFRSIGLTPPYSQALRYHPSVFCPVLNTKLPAILAPLAQIGTPDAIQAITAIWLDPHSASALRFSREDTRGLLFRGDRYRAGFGFNRTGVINLDAVAERMVIAKYIETAMAAGQELGLPAIAWLGGSVDIVSSTLPATVRSVVIALQGSSPSKGAERMAASLTERGVTVELMRPPNGMADWLDVVKARA